MRAGSNIASLRQGGNPLVISCPIRVVIGGLMKETAIGAAAAHQAAGSSVEQAQSFILGFWGVRYQVRDVSRSVAFYTEQLGFKLDRQTLPAFAQVSVGNLKLILSGPGASGSDRCPTVITRSPAGGTG